MQNILVSWTSNIAVTAIQITAYVTGTETVTHTNTDFLMYIEKIIQPEMESGVASFVNLSQKNPTSYTLQAYMQEGFAQRFKELNLMLYTVQYSSFHQALHFSFPPRIQSG